MIRNKKMVVGLVGMLAMVGACGDKKTMDCPKLKTQSDCGLNTKCMWDTKAKTCKVKTSTAAGNDGLDGQSAAGNGAGATGTAGKKYVCAPKADIDWSDLCKKASDDHKKKDECNSKKLGKDKQVCKWMEKGKCHISDAACTAFAMTVPGNATVAASGKVACGRAKFTTSAGVVANLKEICKTDSGVCAYDSTKAADDPCATFADQAGCIHGQIGVGSASVSAAVGAIIAAATHSFKEMANLCVWEGEAKDQCLPQWDKIKEKMGCEELTKEDCVKDGNKEVCQLIEDKALKAEKAATPAANNNS